LPLYAYKSKERVETLREHVINGLKAIDAIYLESGLSETLAKRLGITREELAVTLKRAYLLHDVGKAYSPFQTRIDSGKSVPGHEVASAASVLKTLSENAESIATAILLHHHAIRGVKDAIKKALELGNEFKLHENYWSELHDVHESLKVEKPPEKIYREDLEKLLKAIISVQYDLRKALHNRSESISYIMVYAILHPLITADVIAATLASKNLKDKMQKIIVNELRGYVKEFLASRLKA